MSSSMLRTLMVLALLALPLPLLAESAPSIRIEGRGDVVVTTAQISLGDIAAVTSPRVSDDDAVIALKRVVIERSPAPGEVLQLTGQQVLERLRSAGVNLKQVGYLLPAKIQVSRAGRPLLTEEVTRAIEQFLMTTDRQITLRHLHYGKPLMVPTGDVRLAVTALGTGRQGLMSFEVAAYEGSYSAANIAARTQVDASIEEWREVPVAQRPITKGSVIGSDDIAMARMNIASLPRDAVLSMERVVGFEASQNLAAGDPFRRDKLSIPALVNTGAKVTMLYRVGALEATATGVALQAGAAGDEIRVRNDSSSKIVVGVVAEPGLVMVGATQHASKSRQ